MVQRFLKMQNKENFSLFITKIKILFIFAYYFKILRILYCFASMIYKKRNKKRIVYN